MSIRVLLVDDHEIVRRGLRDLLDGEPGIEVVAEAGSVSEALVRANADRPDVAVVDVRLPDGDGVALCRTLRELEPAPACLVLTAFDDEQAMVEAIMMVRFTVFSSCDGGRDECRGRNVQEGATRSAW